jgi:hypothetical protein
MRKGEEMPTSSVYTVYLKMPGFPVFFLCPHCMRLHSFPENLQEANFLDPGQASQVFKTEFPLVDHWEYISNEKMQELGMVTTALWQMSISLELLTE